MKTFNVLDHNDVILNTIVAEEQFMIDNFQYYEEVVIDNSIVQEVPLTTIEFMGLFTPIEKFGIYESAKVNSGTMIVLDEMKFAKGISLKDPKTITGLDYLESQGLLTAARNIEIKDS